MAKASGNVYTDLQGRQVIRYRLPDGTDTRKILGMCGEAAAQAELDFILAPWRTWTDDTDPKFWLAAQHFMIDRRNRGRRETTLSEYKRIVNLVLPHLSDFRLSQIGKREMETLRVATTGAINQTKSVLAGIVRVARKRYNYTGPDFSEWFERAPSSPKLEMDVYTTAEIEQLASAMERSDHLVPLAARILRILAYTGMRISEVQALRWNDIDYAKNQIRVDERYNPVDGYQPPKNGRVRYVPMAQQVVNALGSVGSAVVYGEDAIICEYFTRAWFRQHLDEACRLTGIRRMTIHSLRHLFASLMVQRFPLTDVQEWCGHASIATTQRYVHYIPKRDAAQKMTELLGGTDV